jgi:succinate dehydrogenase / fumarate reductase flavoprotein subunit
MLLHTLYEKAVEYEQAAERGEMIFYDEWFVTRLVVEDDTAVGIIALNTHTGELEAIKGDAIIFATGGAGRVYGKTTNALISTGLGQVIPYWAGIPLKDMEFIQFHPTTLYGTNILITEGARGEGGYLLNNKGERFLANYNDSAKAMEVAPRDIVSRNITREIMVGRGFENAYVHLDLRHLGAKKILERLPGIRDLAMHFVGIDPIEQSIPVQPGTHYTMGGIDTDENGATKITGFYAAGEAACVSVHGANRLGGNSLLETIVFGAIAGESAAKFILAGGSGKSGDDKLKKTLTEEDARLHDLEKSTGDEDPAKIKNELGTVMSEKAWVFRDKDTLTEGLEKIRELKNRYKSIRLKSKGRKANFDLIWSLELQGNLELAEIILMGALAREESRGSQSRTDFPKRDDENWLKHTLATYTPEGPKLSYSEVDISRWEPKERKY